MRSDFWSCVQVTSIAVTRIYICREDCDFGWASSLDPTRRIENTMSYYSERDRWRGAYQSPTREQHNRTVVSWKKGIQNTQRMTAVGQRMTGRSTHISDSNTHTDADRWSSNLIDIKSICRYIWSMLLFAYKVMVVLENDRFDRQEYGSVYQNSFTSACPPKLQ